MRTGVQMDRVLTPERTELLKQQVRNRVNDHFLSGGELYVEKVLLDGYYHEQQRLKSEPASPLRQEESRQWAEVREKVFSRDHTALAGLLAEIVAAHTDEVAGKFDPRVYRVSTSILPAALSVLLSTPNLKKLAKQGLHLPNLNNIVRIGGQTSAVQSLVQKGTVVLVPTHFSHLDSVVVGYAIDQLGLPPFAYGAGLNLFTNPLLSFFMHNLGAYKVDRKKRHLIYKEVLKTYTTASLEARINNLFFPGGTRSRSGAVEDRLKKGLLGCGLSAYIQNLKQKRANPDVFIVPANISFQLVLEAETLIEDFLKEVGKNRVIIEHDESRDLKKIAHFMLELVKLDSRIYVTFGQAMDPFGNKVDADGISRDGRGRPIDTRHYVQIDGEPVEDEARDRQFTNELSEGIVAELHRCNVIQSTHLCARAMWRVQRNDNPNSDLFRLLRTGGRRPTFERAELIAAAQTLLEEVGALAADGALMLDEMLKPGQADRVVDDALRHFATYHTEPAIRAEGTRVRAVDQNLIYYYQHRLDGYGLA